MNLKIVVSEQTHTCKDTVIPQEDFLQFRQLIDSFQVFYVVVVGLQHLQVWRERLITS